MLGHFNNGSPHIEIEVSGPVGSNKKLLALIDTGFNGELQLPFQEAFPLGLLLVGTEDVSLADNSIRNCFICLGTVTLEGKTEIMNIMLQPTGDILLGTKLLEKLGKELVVDFVNKSVEVNNKDLIVQTSIPTAET